MIRVYLFYRVNCIFVCFCIVKSSTFFFFFGICRRPVSVRAFFWVMLLFFSWSSVELSYRILKMVLIHPPALSELPTHPFPSLFFISILTILFYSQSRTHRWNCFPKFRFLHYHPTSQSHDTEVANFGWLSCCWVFWPIFVESKRIQVSDSTTCFWDSYSGNFKWEIWSFVWFWW